jgi:hypothetical protein
MGATQTGALGSMVSRWEHGTGALEQMEERGWQVEEEGKYGRKW